MEGVLSGDKYYISYLGNLYFKRIPSHAAIYNWNVLHWLYADSMLTKALTSLPYSLRSRLGRGVSVKATAPTLGYLAIIKKCELFHRPRYH